MDKLRMRQTRRTRTKRAYFLSPTGSEHFKLGKDRENRRKNIEERKPV